MHEPAPHEPRGWLDRTREGFAPENADGTTSATGRRRAMALLFTSLIANGLGQTVMFAMLPPLAKDLGLTEIGVGAVFAVSALLWVFSSAYWGARSDVWGRRPVILIGIAAFAISTFTFASVLQFGLWHMIPTALIFPLMVATRSIYGLFGAGAYPAAQGYIADRTSASERTEGIAMLNAAFGLGAAVGPGVGAALTVFGVVAPLYFVAFMAFVSTIAVWLLLPERSAPHQRKIEKALSWFDPRVLPFVVFAVMQGTAGSIPTQTVAFMIRDMQKLSISETQQLAGVALMGMAIAALFAQFVLVQRFKLTTRFLIIAGIIVAIISNLLVVVAPNYGLLSFALVLSGLGFGMLRPGIAAAASLSVSSEEQGAMAGLTGGAGAAGFIFAPLVGNGLYSWSHVAPYWFGAILMALLLLFVITNSRIKTAVIQTFDGTSSDIQPP